VSPALPLPKYHRIYLLLREQLGDGSLAGTLPGEVALAARFGVARVTVRKALEQLAAEGLVERSPGRGTVARRPPAAVRGMAGGAARPLSGLLENIVSMGLATRVRVLECTQVAATEAVAQVLRLAPGAPVHKAVRVRSTREGPLSLITTHVPAALAAGIDRRALAREPLLVLLERAGVRIGHAQQAISARLADDRSAAALGVAVGSALLAVSRLVHDAAGTPVQWLQGLYRPDRYEYRMELSRVGGIDARVWVSDAFPGPAPTVPTARGVLP
jgi:GntR family transcriptional regulator